MVKRTPPLAIGVIGTGEASAKQVDSLLTDYTAPYADVTFILPVDEEHWSPTMDATFQWVTDNDIPFVAVTTSGSPSKKMKPILEAAADTLKVARISTKVVQLLQQEKGEGDVALLVAWDDDDQEAVTAVNKALTAEVRAFNLLDGLDEFSFDDESESAEDADAPIDRAEPEPEDDVERDAHGAGDDYDDWGVRKLRQALRDRADEHDIPDRTIGTLDKDDAIRALRNVDAGRGKAKAAEEPEDEDTPAVLDESIGKSERTTRARRAFREGVAEATGQDEAQADLPNSRGGTLLEEQSGDPDAEPETGDDEPVNTTAAGPSDELGLRAAALDMAIRAGKSGADAIADAMKYEVYLRGQRQSPGRPRADGSPAQPRAINPETGKPIRRRGSRSTD